MECRPHVRLLKNCCRQDKDKTEKGKRRMKNTANNRLQPDRSPGAVLQKPKGHGWAARGDRER